MALAISFPLLLLVLVLPKSIDGAGESIFIDENLECLTEEVEFSNAVNAFRKKKGLWPVPISATLPAVARAHAMTMEEADNPYKINPFACNGHSWGAGKGSDTTPTMYGTWDACCSDDGHTNLDCMHHKPKIISGGMYTAAGYEISGNYGGGYTNIIDAWDRSDGYRPWLLSSGNPNRNMGCAKVNGWSACWFGSKIDNRGICKGAGKERGGGTGVECWETCKKSGPCAFCGPAKKMGKCCRMNFDRTTKRNARGKYRRQCKTVRR